MILLYFCVCVCVQFLSEIYFYFTYWTIVWSPTQFSMSCNPMVLWRVNDRLSFTHYPCSFFFHFLISNLPRPPSEHTSWMAPTTSPIYNWQGASQTKKKSKNKINSSGTEIPSNKTHLFHNFYGFLDYKNRISSLWVNLNVSMFLLISA